VPEDLIDRLNLVVNNPSAPQETFMVMVKGLLEYVSDTKNHSQSILRDVLEAVQHLKYVRNQMPDDKDYFKNVKSESLRRGIPPHLLDLLIYVIHKESVDCLGNHVLKFSKFECERRKAWIAGITLRSWRVAFTGPQPTHAVQGFSDDEPIYLPLYLESVARTKIAGRSGKKLPLEMLSFELDTSSIVMSTNTFGDFSKCTIVSDLLDNESMRYIVQDARRLWNKFIHQPQTARCLVFFLVLGKICEHLTQNYANAIDEISPFLVLNVS
jgi:hypothetical protein